MHIQETEGAHPRGLFKSPTLTVPSQVYMHSDFCLKQASDLAEGQHFSGKPFQKHSPLYTQKTMLSKSMFTEGFG
jgi:hypothetical protein